MNFPDKTANINDMGGAAEIFTASSKNVDLFSVDQAHQLHL